MRTMDSEEVSNRPAPNPKRVAAGKRNRALRRELTPAGRERLRAAALRDQPWRLSTGPRTAAGKARAAQNGMARQIGPLSVRAIRAELTLLRRLAADMQAARRLAGPPGVRPG